MQPSPSFLPLSLQLTFALIPTISAVFAAIGLILNVMQSRRTNRQARATVVSKFLSDFANDEDMQGIFYAIEYSKFYYDDDFHDSENERKLDKTLIHFTNLALAWKFGLLEDRDIFPVQYFVRRLLRDEGVTAYLRFIDNLLDHTELGEHPYQALKDMGRVLGV